MDKWRKLWKIAFSRPIKLHIKFLLQEKIPINQYVITKEKKGIPI